MDERTHDLRPRYFVFPEWRRECLMDDDFAIALVPSPELKRALKDSAHRFGHTCYATDIKAALRERRAMFPDEADMRVHGEFCVDCGADDGDVVYCADVASGRNLCFACLDKTLLPRMNFLVKHHRVCLWSSPPPVFG